MLTKGGGFREQRRSGERDFVIASPSIAFRVVVPLLPWGFFGPVTDGAISSNLDVSSEEYVYLFFSSLGSGVVD